MDSLCRQCCNIMVSSVSLATLRTGNAWSGTEAWTVFVVSVVPMYHNGLYSVSLATLRTGNAWPSGTEVWTVFVISGIRILYHNGL